MKLTSILAIYLLFWTLALFLVLPFGVRTPEEEGTSAAPGHAESAPHRFDFGKVALRAGIVAAVLTALYVANYIYGWIRVDDLDWLNR
jgi:predicted secreted protein